MRQVVVISRHIRTKVFKAIKIFVVNSSVEQLDVEIVKVQNENSKLIVGKINDIVHLVDNLMVENVQVIFILI